MSPTALVDFPCRPAQLNSARERLAFGIPREWIVAHTLADVRSAIDAAHQASQAGAWCVGYVRYEAASAFDPALQTLAADGPLVCFAVFNETQAWPAFPPEKKDPPHSTADWHARLSSETFNANIERIHECIRAGEVYQINYTSQLRSEFSGDALAYFHALHRSQPGGYSVYLDTRQGVQGAGEFVLSVSPELFFDWRADCVTTQPMKGTASRGLTPVDDQAAAERLHRSEKERAENLMIVDLLRNDLARIAQVGGVEVPALFELHALPTVWQMTSTVRATVRAGLSLSDLFAALFPCGSVTGAPKVRAMHHIAQFEDEARGVYCGAVGMLAPGGHATFNVPIRTVMLGAGQTSMPARCGVGSGITIDSQAGSEHLEWRNKQRFLDRAAQPFKLLESLRLEDGRIWLFAEHLERLQHSAAELNFNLDLPAVCVALQRVAQQRSRGTFKLRLLVAHNGHIELEAQPLQAITAPLRVNLSKQPIAVLAGASGGLPSDFIRHKTTRREIYAAHAAQDGAFDTLLWNEAGELTEFTIGNVALLLDDQWLTPHLPAGLLSGTYRRRLIRQGALQEARLTKADLMRTTSAAFFNSVRGWLPIDLKRLQAQVRGAPAPE